ncbi:Dolichol kinase sec59 [Zalerion maritima]|uniref:dolichol kinase n=1 Tax=Zalerion maritima TaxID=339359 RepID=A0AAD5WTD4_9PEZI|nr:Dolichol kinase sec59 [Zalerion maritima]
MPDSPSSKRPPSRQSSPSGSNPITSAVPPSALVPSLEVTDEQDSLRLLSRSPHPYHHRSSELPFPADQLEDSDPSTPANTTPPATSPRHVTSFPSFAKDSGPSSDSGTEADDEHFLKGLPASRVLLHKGLRGRNEALSGSSTPLLSPAILEEEGRRISFPLQRDAVESGRRTIAETARRKKEVIRRSAECLVLACLAFIWQTDSDVKDTTRTWSREILSEYLAIVFLFLAYPMRVAYWTYTRRSNLSAKEWPFRIPSAFDPAPLLYPHAVTLFVSILIAVDVKAAVLPNLILGLCTLPRPLMPFAENGVLLDPVHWVVSCIPLFVFQSTVADNDSTRPFSLHLETATLLYPLHQSLTFILHFLATTSLLAAELQLLSVALINVLLLASSPQMAFLRSVLWVGGLMILVLCAQVIKWGITLARVPKWRFRRESSHSKRSWLGSLPALAQVKRDLMGSDSEASTDSGLSTDEERELSLKEKIRRFRAGAGPSPPSLPDFHLFPAPSNPMDNSVPKLASANIFRRHTIPRLPTFPRAATHTPAGRKKRSASTSVRQFFALTYRQAALRKWLYAGYVQTTIFAIFLAAVRPWIGYDALMNMEPIGWFLGYMLGDQQWFRWKVVSTNLERWIPLPPRTQEGDIACCGMGWVQHIRHVSFGEANTRLLVSTYWILIVAFGLFVVFRLSPFYEVDTRRKVFHFMMVAMLLPATYIDPTFAALALSAVLVVFLLLDLIRASQLPPFSKPIANFLTPYVDGRDLRGPVVISHIFLLIGCAIPLWLTLASLPRTGEGVMKGWEIPTREVSMVSGVICVGLGDAAASLIGRRWGHKKWLWGGGKSLEGSVAFTIAVFVGLMLSAVWLRIGGWPPTPGSNLSWPAATRNSGVCASMASLTEAVLTGGNDNVVVPVVLWTCVKSLGV